MRLENIYINYGLGLTLALLLFAACGKMDETYSEYIKNGEIIYVGRVDSLKTFPGNNRIKLTWKMPSDPKITKIKIFWNNRADSIIQDVQGASGSRKELIIDGLNEGAYAFDVYTFDNYGNSSILTTESGTSYGTYYLKALLNRPIKSVKFASGVGTVDWFSVSPTITSNIIIYTEITYKNISGIMTTVKVFPSNQTSQLSTNLPNYKSGDSISYKTLYIPVKNAVDSFYSKTDKRRIP